MNSDRPTGNDQGWDQSTWTTSQTAHSPQSPNASSTSGRTNRLLLPTAIAVCILSLASVAIAVVFASGDETSSKQAPQSIPESLPTSTFAVEVSTTKPAASTSTTTTTPVEPEVFTATVVRTGILGDGDEGYVTIRTSPDYSPRLANEVRRAFEGETLFIECQVPGEMVTSRRLGIASNLWARDTDGNFLSMIYLDIAGWNFAALDHPCPKVGG